MSRPKTVRLALLSFLVILASARLAPARADEKTPAHAATADQGSAAGHGEAAHEANPDILQLQPSLMTATVIVFLILLGILWKFAWGPLSEALTERERKQEETIRLAEEARAESARLLAEHKKQMDTAAEQVRQMLEEARRQSDANAQRIAQEAQAAAEATRERAEREIGTAKEQALSEIWSKTADLAVSVAGRVLSKEMSHDDHRRLVDAAVGELPASPNGQGSHRA